MENLETREYSNFVTPPDFVTEFKHTVLIVDAVDTDINELGKFCQVSPVNFNIYLYNVNMDFLDWMSMAGDRSDAIIINTIDNNIWHVKELLAELDNTWYYGPKSFANNNNRLDGLMDYFMSYIQTVK